MKNFKYLIVLLIFLSMPSFGQRGCCSWHGGVLGCNGKVGKLVCRDGTYSPTCRCPIGATSINQPMNNKKYLPKTKYFTAHQLNILCNSQKVGDQTSCAFYLFGVVEGINWASTSERIAKIKLNATDNKLKVVNYPLVYRAYIANHPGHLANPAGLEAIIALTKAKVLIGRKIDELKKCH